MNTLFNLFQSSVAFQIEVSLDLQFNLFYVKYNTSLKSESFMTVKNS